MREDILHPRRSSELVILAQGGNKMSAVFQSGIGNLPRIALTIRVLDADRSRIGIRISGVPSGISIPDDLSDLAVGLHLIMCRGFSVLPDVVASSNGQISSIMVKDDLVDRTGATGGEMLSKDEIFISFNVIPIFHDNSFGKRRRL